MVIIKDLEAIKSHLGFVIPLKHLVPANDMQMQFTFPSWSH